jgi:hypothetical protein
MLIISIKCSLGEITKYANDKLKHPTRQDANVNL